MTDEIRYIFVMVHSRFADTNRTDSYTGLSNIARDSAAL